MLRDIRNGKIQQLRSEIKHSLKFVAPALVNIYHRETLYFRTLYQMLIMSHFARIFASPTVTYQREKVQKLMTKLSQSVVS
ncbi:CLUMA_CG011075, isoform A [Clunio marinus]|uniref:CLUMA_CG011075, isoform A n=1 Tax=Clunio marinus TaxID=568069 RepID=A0A1J1IBN7_9DIPT|nr:CLUMA_CG011075, isoform A [Clunio marinus]